MFSRISLVSLCLVFLVVSVSAETKTADKLQTENSPQILGLANSAWQPLGSGMNGVIYALTIYNGELIAGGSFTTAGGVEVNYVARWDGSSWQPLGTGTNYEVRSLAVHSGYLVAGGGFTMAGSTSALHIARWNGSSWSSLGLGISDPVIALTAYNNYLIAGGHFLTAGGLPAYEIARWNGSYWQSLDGGMTGGGGLWTTPGVFSLTVYGDLIAGGLYTTAGSTPVSNIASWNGAAWDSLGAGVTAPSSIFGIPYAGVQAMTVYDGDLIAGGNIIAAGENPAWFIASWDGSSWDSLGNGMNEKVLALTVYDNELIAGGEFTLAGATAADRIAHWDGASWQAIGAGVNGIVRAMTVYNDELIVAGEFTTAGDIPANYIARWGAEKCCTNIRGNVNGDPLDAVNIADVTFLVTYLFSDASAPAPPCWREGNANGDPLEKVNISDVTYLTEYLFGIPNGPEPPNCP